MLPQLTDHNRPYWTGGSSGSLMIPRCDDCGRWVDPVFDQCQTCEGSVHHEPVSGRGSVFSFTVNRHEYHPNVPPPTVIAIVQLDEQDDLRIVTNVVGCDPSAVRCGLAVQVDFEQHGEVYYPVFTPAEAAA